MAFYKLLCITLLLGMVTLCASRRLDEDDKDYLRKVIRNWEDAPRIKHFMSGKLTSKRWLKIYTFQYESEEGSTCDAKIILKYRKDGGKHTNKYYECKSNTIFDDEEEFGPDEGDSFDSVLDDFLNRADF